ncbi:MAG: hypothetical protein RIC56_06950 [Pseudomonadales bacterium]
MASRPKYSLPERERRWLVDATAAAPLLSGTPQCILDRYLDDTRLRLRRITAADGGEVYKLCKKYGDLPPGAESITNLYLDTGEFARLAALPGWQVDKQRFRVHEGSLDVYRSEDDSLRVFEHDFIDAASAAAYRPPAFTEREITADPDFTGAALARRFGRHYPQAER